MNSAVVSRIRKCKVTQCKANASAFVKFFLLIACSFFIFPFRTLFLSPTLWGRLFRLLLLRNFQNCPFLALRAAGSPPNQETTNFAMHEPAVLLRHRLKNLPSHDGTVVLAIAVVVVVVLVVVEGFFLSFPILRRAVSIPQKDIREQRCGRFMQIFE